MKMIDVLAIDLGASNGRGIVGNFDGNVLKLSEIHRFPNEMVKVGKSCYWDFLRLYNDIKTTIAKAVRASGPLIASLGIDGWAQDFGLLDQQGNLLGQVHSYRDPRWEGKQAVVAGQISDRDYYRITGMQPGGIASLFQLLGMREQEKALYDAAETFLFVPDLANYLLTGEKACNVTLAGLSGLYDISRRCWSQETIGAAGLPEFFPRLSGTHEILGNIQTDLAQELSCVNLPVVSVTAHDTMSALAFAPGRGEKTALLSSGTWSVLGRQLAEPDYSDAARQSKFFNEVGFDHEILLLRNITGLWMVQELKREWEAKGIRIDMTLLNEDCSRSDFAGTFDVDSPEFSMSGDMEKKIRNYMDKTQQAQPASQTDIYRCVLHSLAKKYREVLALMENIGSMTFDTITIVGGGSRNIALNQLVADTCNIRVSAGPAEASAIGNICCQLMALGELKNADEARELVASSCPADKYWPNKNAKPF